MESLALRMTASPGKAVDKSWRGGLCLALHVLFSPLVLNYSLHISPVSTPLYAYLSRLIDTW